jgi:hypothetical protein
MSFVTCKCFAQTGNVMFQIAMTIAHALKHGVEYKIPRQGHSPELPTIPFAHLPQWNPSDGLGAPYVEQQEHFGLYHDVPYWPKMRLHGYWQNEKYFKNYRKEIIEAFQLHWKYHEGIVGIHIRRGDYLNNPHKFLSPNHAYLSESIKYFIDRQEVKAFAIFSDDIAWCKEYFSYNHPKHQFIFNEGYSALEDMSMLSGCEHQIISASTFSWWAAWLNQNPNKIVVCPEHWFGPGNSHLNSSEICPREWIRVPNPQ